MFEDEEDHMNDLAYPMSSVNASDWGSNIDASVSVAFTVIPSFEYQSIPSSYVSCCNDMSIRG